MKNTFIKYENLGQKCKGLFEIYSDKGLANPSGLFYTNLLSGAIIQIDDNASKVHVVPKTYDFIASGNSTPQISGLKFYKTSYTYASYPVYYDEMNSYALWRNTVMNLWILSAVTGTGQSLTSPSNVFYKNSTNLTGAYTASSSWSGSLSLIPVENILYVSNAPGITGFYGSYTSGTYTLGGISRTGFRNNTNSNFYIYKNTLPSEWRAVEDLYNGPFTWYTNLNGNNITPPITGWLLGGGDKSPYISTSYSPAPETNFGLCGANTLIYPNYIFQALSPDSDINLVKFYSGGLINNDGSSDLFPDNKKIKDIFLDTSLNSSLFDKNFYYTNYVNQNRYCLFRIYNTSLSGSWVIAKISGSYSNGGYSYWKISGSRVSYDQTDETLNTAQNVYKPVGTSIENLKNITIELNSNYNNTDLYETNNINIQNYSGYLNVKSNKSYLITNNSAANWLDFGISKDSKYLTVIGTNQPIYISSNSGLNWDERDVPRSWKSIAMSTGGRYQSAVAGIDNATYTDSWSKIWVSNDYGKTWSIKYPTGYSNMNFTDIAVSNDGKYQTVIHSHYSGRIFYSNDYGNNWNLSTLTSFMSPDYNYIRNPYKIAMSDDGSYQIVCKGWSSEQLQDFFVSNNYGSSFGNVVPNGYGGFNSTIIDPNNVNQNSQKKGNCIGVDMNSNGSNITIITDGYINGSILTGSNIYLSNDYGSTWSNAIQPINGQKTLLTDISILRKNNKYQAITSQAGQVFISSNSGANWSATGNQLAWKSVSIDNNTGIFAVNQFGISKFDLLTNSEQNISVQTYLTSTIDVDGLYEYKTINSGIYSGLKCFSGSKYIFVPPTFKITNARCYDNTTNIWSILDTGFNFVDMQNCESNSGIFPTNYWVKKTNLGAEGRALNTLNLSVKKLNKW